MTLPSYSIELLETLPGFDASGAKAINERGQVIGYSYRERDEARQACLWEAGRVHDLGPGAMVSINNKGQSVGSRLTPCPTFLAVISENGKTRKLFKNNPSISDAQGINDSGIIVGLMQTSFARSKSPAHIKRGIFVLDCGKRRYLEIPAGYHAGDGADINNQGTIVGHAWLEHACDEHAILWTQDSTTLLGEPHGFRNSQAVAINNQCHVLVTAIESNLQDMFTEAFPSIELDGQHNDAETNEIYDTMIAWLSAMPDSTLRLRHQSYLWKEGNWQSLDGLGIGHALNDSDQVVGWIGCDPKTAPGANEEGDTHAALWQCGTVVDLNDALPPDSGWLLSSAHGINNLGQIVGNGMHNDKQCAFLLTPI